MTFHSPAARARLLVTLSIGWAGACVDQPFATNVDLPLQVLQINPSDGAVNVARESVVKATFNLPLVASSISGKTFVVEELSQSEDATEAKVVEGTLTYEAGKGDAAPTVTFAPSGPLPYSTRFRITLVGSDLKGDALQRDTEPRGALLKTVTAEFTTEVPPPLAVISVEPADGATGVAPSSSIRVTFSEPVRCETLVAGAKLTETFDPHPHNGDQAGTTVDVAGAWVCTDPPSIEDTGCDDGACTVTFAPAEAFSLSSLVTLTLQGGTRADGAVESFRATGAGGQLPAPVTSSFRVEDPSPLLLLSSDPADGATEVSLQTGMVLVFSEPLDCTTITADDVTVTETLDSGIAGSLVAVTVESCDGASVTLSFEPDFAYSATIDIVVSETVESDRATSRGGQLAGGAAITFQTENPPDLRVVSTDPGNGSSRAILDTNLTVLFSEDVDCGSLVPAEVTVQETYDPRVATRLGTAERRHSVSVASCAGSAIILDVDVDFQLSSTVTVTLPGTIRSTRATTVSGQLEGGAGYSWSFTSDDPTAFVVVTTSPGDGNILVPHDGPLVVRFSESVDPASVGETSFLVEELEEDVFGNLQVVAQTSASCVVGTGPCSYEVVGDTVTFTPPADFSFDTRYRFTLTTALSSLRATGRAGSLPVELTYTFTTVPTPPIELDSFSPPTTQPVATTSTFSLTFNQDVFGVQVDLTQPPPTVFLARVLDTAAAPDPANAVSIVCENGCATGATYSFRPTTPLPEGLYALVIKGGVGGIRGTVGGSLLFDDIVLVYRVVEQLVTNPADGDVEVPVTSPVCVTFLRNVNPTAVRAESFSLTATDELLGETQLPVLFDISGADPVTGVPSTAFSSNKICLIAQPSTIPCRPVDELLPADTVITFTIALDDRTDPEDPIIANQVIRFATAGLPELVETRFDSVPEVGLTEALAGNLDVPVNATLTLTFSDDVDAASLAAVRLQTAAGVAIAGTASVRGTEVTFDANALLAFSTAHELRVVGGTSGLLFADGRYLGDDLVVAFTASPANTAHLSPVTGENALETTVTPIVFSRPMFQPSLNSATITAHDTTLNAAINGAVATSVDDLFSAVFNPLPTYASGHDVTVTVTTGALDARGNPLPSATSVRWPSVQGAPAANARIPDAVSAASVSPTNGGTIAGDGEIVLTLPTNTLTKLNNRMLPQSFNDASMKLSQTGTCGGVAAHALAQTHSYVFATTPGGADSVHIHAQESFRAGCSYAVTFKQSLFTNIHTIGNDAGPDVTVTFTGETTAPTLNGTNVDGNPTNVGGGSTLVASFNEKIDPASATSANVTLTDVTAAAPVAISVDVSAQAVTVTPASLLRAGHAYQLHLPGGATSPVRDLAGNALAASQDRTFTVETTAPTVSSVAAAAGGGVVVTFSEAVDPASVVETTFAGNAPAAGTITVTDGTTGIPACLHVNGNVVTIEPFGIGAGTNLTVTITDGVTDLAGNAVGVSTTNVTTLP